MHDREHTPTRDPGDRRVDPGLGVLCPEAQADGVPCSEMGRECDICPMAAPNRNVPDPTDTSAQADEPKGPTPGDW